MVCGLLTKCFCRLVGFGFFFFTNLDATEDMLSEVLGFFCFFFEMTLFVILPSLVVSEMFIRFIHEMETGLKNGVRPAHKVKLSLGRVRAVLGMYRIHISEHKRLGIMAYEE